MRRRKQATAEEFLDRVETEALRGITDPLRRAADELGSNELYQSIRSHPWLASTVSVGAGFVAGPQLVHGLRRMTSATWRLVSLRILASGVLSGVVRTFFAPPHGWPAMLQRAVRAGSGRSCARAGPQVRSQEATGPSS